jgi:hypothetical protein
LLLIVFLKSETERPFYGWKHLPHGIPIALNVVRTISGVEKCCKRKGFYSVVQHVRGLRKHGRREKKTTENAEVTKRYSSLTLFM